MGKLKSLGIAASLVVGMSADVVASPLELMALFRPIEPGDAPELLVPEMMFERNIYQLDSRGLKQAEMPTKPWANSFWAYQNGQIARRYGDHDFERETRFSDRYKSFERKTPEKIWASKPGRGKNNNIAALSPAEKYDFLIGDSKFSLTRAIWGEAMMYYNRDRFGGPNNGPDGKPDHHLEDWLGICEGTAAASVVVPEPVKEVKLTLPDPGFPGQNYEVRFNARDIKGLAGLLWSSYNFSNPTVIGQKCKTGSPARDAKGVITDPSCFDSNPGTVYLALTNLLGANKRWVFINEAGAAPQIWNVPVVAYRASYFDVRNRRPVSNLSEAVVERSKWKDDPYAHYRSARAASLVGVQLEVYFSASGEPPVNGSRDAERRMDRLVFDLELDADGNILGGEWHDDSLIPDYMWVIPTDYRPYTTGDRFLRGQFGDAYHWDGRSPIPGEWLHSAQFSGQILQPLAEVVERLVELSKK